MVALKTLCPHPAWDKTHVTWPSTALTRSWTGKTHQAVIQEKLLHLHMVVLPVKRHIRAMNLPTKDVGCIVCVCMCVLFLFCFLFEWHSLVTPAVESKSGLSCFCRELRPPVAVKHINLSSYMRADKGLMWITRRPVRTCGLGLRQGRPPLPPLLRSQRAHSTSSSHALKPHFILLIRRNLLYFPSL